DGCGQVLRVRAGRSANGQVLPKVNDDGAAGIGSWLLHIRSINKRGRRHGEPILLDVADHTNDLTGPLLVLRERIEAEQQLLADGILFGKVTMSECFVDDNGPGCSWRVVFIQLA